MENGCVFSKELFPSFAVVLYDFGAEHSSSHHRCNKFNKHSSLCSCAFADVPLY